MRSCSRRRRRKYIMTLSDAVLSHLTAGYPEIAVIRDMSTTIYTSMLLQKNSKFTEAFSKRSYRSVRNYAAIRLDETGLIGSKNRQQIFDIKKRRARHS